MMFFFFLSLVVPIGGRCENTSECADPNCECIELTCACKDGYYDNGGLTRSGIRMCVEGKFVCITYDVSRKGVICPSQTPK